jgi:hypothetical protein
VAPSYTDFQPTELEANPQQEFDTLENQANAPVRGPYETARSVDIANWTLLSTMRPRFTVRHIFSINRVEDDIPNFSVEDKSSLRLSLELGQKRETGSDVLRCSWQVFSSLFPTVRFVLVYLV